MKINGEEKMLEREISLGDFLEKEGFPSAQIAVEHNGVIVPKGEYANVILSDSDTLEVVTFVGGG